MAKHTTAVNNSYNILAMRQIVNRMTGRRHVKTLTSQVAVGNNPIEDTASMETAED